MEISLLYPSLMHKENHYSGKDIPFITDDVLNDLGINSIFDLRNGSLCDFFTTDKEVIEYRQQVFSDMLKCEELSHVLVKLSPIISDIAELRKLSTEVEQSESYLYGITEVELYVSCIELLEKELLPLKDKLTSKAFLSLVEKVEEVARSEYYIDLNKNVGQLSSRVRDIKSVTIGVNLDARLRAESAGIISVNSEKFRSGALLQKILRLDFKTDEYTCIAELEPFSKKDNENQQNALNNAFNGALNNVFKASMRSWKKVVQAYVLDNAEFLIKLLPEIEFIVKATELMRALSQTGNEMSFPQIEEMSKKTFEAEGMFNPVVAYKLSEKMVLNSFVFDEKGTFYVLSGPNRGGKSVITCAVGLTFVFTQLGLQAPAQKLKISPADAIFTHFPVGGDDTIEKGRLGEECARLDLIFDRVTENSLVLLDETLSSTGSYEASYIASEVLAGISMVKCRGIFSTHLHELSAMINDINTKCIEQGGARIDTLVAGIEDGERSFVITRKKPDGRSYARDIASKYGISLETILEKIQKNK